MIYNVLYNGKLIPLILHEKEISSGGQGTIYRITSPIELKDYCVKIYKDISKSSINKKKIEFMIANTPRNVEMANIKICWPKYMVFYDNDQFAGFVMPLAFEDSRDLKIIEINNFGKTIAQKYPQCTGWHNKFELNTKEGFINRLKLLHNWALALEIIHSSGKYVLVDLKPENVLSTPKGKISIVDTDSFQITDGKRFFQGPVATSEYFAKFARERAIANLPQTRDCDCFSLAISFYKILIGAHPFSGYKLLPPYDTDDYGDITSRINEELFVFGKKKQFIQLLKSNNMHDNFHKLPLDLQKIFIDSLSNTKQYSAEAWKDALKRMIYDNSYVEPNRNKLGELQPVNSESRCLCVLVVDVSGSMRNCMNSLNNALENFILDLVYGRNGFSEVSKEQIEIAIIQFDSEVKILRYPSLINKNTIIPKFHVRGLKTNTIDALDTAQKMIQKRKAQYVSVGLSYYRPWVVLITDGNPNPSSEEKINMLISKTQEDIDQKKYSLSAIGLGNEVDKDFLRNLSKDSFCMIHHSSISRLFKFLSNSIGITNLNDRDEDLLGHFNDADNDISI